MVRSATWISSLMSTLFFIGCQNHTEQTSGKMDSTPVSYRTEELSALYGTPKEKQLYLITKEYDEFRTLVLEFFPDSIRSLQSVEVWEYTWQTNLIDSMLTVWYLPEGDSLKYICHFKHSTYNLY
ncbi:hypothetical protein [Porphyromonas gingivicanis]|uniref:hypothetical protein n=1 Tax=Porphyromonas gingivicanis TaxID=266762 RepID=UPI0011DCB95F|nr:hypothetical protein [Porphyromonas gingivicanis]